MDPENEEELRRHGRVGYFVKVERERTERLRRERERSAAQRRQARQPGHDGECEDFLHDVGIRAEVLSALDWVPLVEVAWSDGELSEAEKRVLLTAAAEDQIPFDHPAHQLLRSWTEQCPGPALFDAWDLHVSVSGRTAEQREEILNRARKVAHASGGVFWMGSVSSAEWDAVDAIEALLS